MNTDKILQDIIDDNATMSGQQKPALEKLRHEFNKLAVNNRSITPIRANTPARDFISAYNNLSNHERETLQRYYTIASERMESGIVYKDPELDFKHRLIMSFFGLFSVVSIILLVIFSIDYLRGGGNKDGGPAMTIFTTIAELFKLLFSL